MSIHRGQLRLLGRFVQFFFVLILGREEFDINSCNAAINQSNKPKMQNAQARAKKRARRQIKGASDT